MWLLVHSESVENDISRMGVKISWPEQEKMENVLFCTKLCTWTFHRSASNLSKFPPVQLMTSNSFIALYLYIHDNIYIITVLQIV